MTIENIWGLVRNEQYDLANEAIRSELTSLEDQKGLSDNQYHSGIVQLFRLGAYNSLRNGEGTNSAHTCNEGRNFLHSARSVESSLGDKLQFRALEGLALASIGLDSESISNMRNVCLRDCDYFDAFFEGLATQDSPQHSVEVAFNAYRDLMNSKDPNADLALGILSRYAVRHEISKWDTRDPHNYVLIPTKVDPKDLMAWSSLRENFERVNKRLHSPDAIVDFPQAI